MRAEKCPSNKVASNLPTSTLERICEQEQADILAIRVVKVVA